MQPVTASQGCRSRAGLMQEHNGFGQKKGGGQVVCHTRAHARDDRDTASFSFKLTLPEPRAARRMRGVRGSRLKVCVFQTLTFTIHTTAVIMVRCLMKEGDACVGGLQDVSDAMSIGRGGEYNLMGPLLFSDRSRQHCGVENSIASASDAQRVVFARGQLEFLSLVTLTGVGSRHLGLSFK